MLITICCPKKFLMEWWCNGRGLASSMWRFRSSNPRTSNLGYLGYLGDLIK